MSEQYRNSPYKISTQHQADKRYEQRKISVRGSLFDPIPNSPNLHDKNGLANSKENYWRDLGSERVKGMKVFT